jgi:hypothetical protein
MCPGCIGSALLLLSGASSAAGGLAAVKLRSISRIRTLRAKTPPDCAVGLSQNGLGPDTASISSRCSKLRRRIVAHTPQAPITRPAT